MRLVRFGAPGQEKPGLLDANDVVRDLSGVVDDIGGAKLSPAGLARLRAIEPASLPAAPPGVRLGACVARPGHFIAVGLNYADHAEESGMAIPAEPVLFSKAPNCIVGPNDDVIQPRGSTKLDWEVELGIVIGSRARYVEEKDARAHIAGFCLANDVSERAFQIERGGQWIKGKSCETFGPLGPFLATPDEIDDVQKLAMWCDVNGERRQRGSTATMIFGVDFLVSYISQFMVLDVGDVIITGTPPGVGLGMKPPLYLKPGDVMTLGIEGLGEQRQKVVPFEG
ncbi:2-keto-4-pentenoate hydratase/2-oxohepta-3-ene-1,7-dioic acid hydratase in catechol pathway [Ancylobacter sp. 3268]|uniref:fumarylacetoacetate hydrolase family protein n=1 Tax=Ancylobacter sp. 3268 TaxID=2817752 RepID=UPI00285B3B2F|nr:fumarylacetoacetate hydrolase family protein [Ancylobacter sp. 3268]MDR6954371.1 2-keto-4-pentenoate hydratase/2-oxohepta-3-ene-1,7-dioic acid hydratase in catechol pathway [Ancylobacter sp. 3268]